MPASKQKKHQIKKEIKYLEDKELIRSFVKKISYENILRYMIEDLDHIDNINNTQSIYLFELVTVLEKALEIYPRLKNV